MKARLALTLVLAGGLAACALGAAAGQGAGAALVAPLQTRATQALAQQGARGVLAHFTDEHGWYTRHPLLTGGERLSDAARVRVGSAVEQAIGTGGVHWAPRPGSLAKADTGDEQDPMLACQSTVEAMLKTRSIRFAEGSASIDPASRGLLDEVAAALRPCAGSIIAVVGHTDAKGDEAANLALSQARSIAVRNALGARGIDLAGVRAKGVGSSRPLRGLDADDPANRRIEFSLIAPVSVAPTVVDAPLASGASGPAGAMMPLWLELGVLAGLIYGLAAGAAWGVRRAMAARKEA